MQYYVIVSVYQNNNTTEFYVYQTNLPVNNSIKWQLATTGRFFDFLTNTIAGNAWLLIKLSSKILKS